MGFGLAFTPSGRLTSVEFESKARVLFDDVPEEEPAGRLKKMAKALAASQGEGLFLLATERFDTAPAPAFAYWRGLRPGGRLPPVTDLHGRKRPLVPEA